ncbi:MAG: ATP synthase F1 subunit gamma [Pseudomonadota bacterium]
MASLKDLKKRLQTVKSTRQITKAMKMVAAAKLRKSQEALLALRPYAYKIAAIINALKERGEGFEHPLLRKRDTKKTRVLIISSDRGLCGSYNSNIIKKAESYLRESGLTGENCVLDFVGRKAYDYFKRRYSNIGDNHKLDVNPTYKDVSHISDSLISSYIEGDFDSLVVVYNEFKSAMTQKLTVEPMFPIIPSRNDELSNVDAYVYEPGKNEIITELLPKYVKVEVFRMLLESLTSEHGARMTAMENATKNSEEMMKRLSLMYNRQRQTAITTELMEIVGGKEALENG